MLFKIKNEEKTTKRVFLDSYTTDEITNLFTGKYNCKFCPFTQIWKGKIPFGQGVLHRSYCKFAYVKKETLPAILNCSKTEIPSLSKKIKEGTKNNKVLFTYPDVVREHPDNPKLFIINVIRVKELNACIIDQHNEGNKMEDKLQKILQDYIKKARY